MEIQLFALSQEEGIEREVMVTIDSNACDVTFESLLKEFYCFCKKIGLEPTTVEVPKDEPSNPEIPPVP